MIICIMFCFKALGGFCPSYHFLENKKKWLLLHNFFKGIADYLFTPVEYISLLKYYVCIFMHTSLCIYDTDETMHLTKYIA